jgi:flagellar assembly factor FliW
MPMEDAVVQAHPEVAERAIEFRSGIYGFPGIRRYVISEIPGGGDVFKQLTALDQPDLGFTLVYPFPFFAEYKPQLTDDQLQEIEAEKPEDVILMVIANVPQEFKQSTVNLKAPILFNPVKQKGLQVILTDEQYTTREPLFKL